MARPGLFLLLAAAASTALAQSVDQLAAQMPSCARTCLLAWAAAEGCGATDYQCQCNGPSRSDPDGTITANCILNSCSTNDSILAATLVDQICILESAAGIGTYPTSYYGFFPTAASTPTRGSNPTGRVTTPFSFAPTGQGQGQTQGGPPVDGLSTGAKAGIAGGVVGGVLIIAVAAGIMMCRRRRAAKAAQATGQALPPPSSVAYVGNGMPELGGQQVAPPAMQAGNEPIKGYMVAFDQSGKPSPQTTIATMNTNPTQSPMTQLSSPATLSPSNHLSQATISPPSLSPSPQNIPAYAVPPQPHHAGHELSGDPRLPMGPAELGGYGPRPSELTGTTAMSPQGTASELGTMSPPPAYVQPAYGQQPYGQQQGYGPPPGVQYAPAVELGAGGHYPPPAELGGARVQPPPGQHQPPPIEMWAANPTYPAQAPQPGASLPPQPPPGTVYPQQWPPGQGQR